MVLTFYVNPNFRVRIMRWMLEEPGCNHGTAVLGCERLSEADKWGSAAPARRDDASGERSRFCAAVNPVAKVPATVHDGQVVTESTAIRAELAETFPAAGLALTAEDRAGCCRRMSFAAEPVEQAATDHEAGFIPE